MHSFFFFNDTATTEIYTLSLHDALPISTERDDALGGDRHLLQQIELVEHFPRAQRDARQRILSLGHREVRFLAQQMIETEEQRATAGDDDALVDDVGRELRRRPLETEIGRAHV